MNARPQGEAGPGSLLRLGVTLAAGRLGRPRSFDPGRAVCHWARAALARNGTDGSGLPVRVGKRGFLLVESQAQSREILDGSPATDGLPPGRLKREAMGFLAPGALTIAHGADWSRLRALHEEVLGFDPQGPLAAPFLACVWEAFEGPVRSRSEIRAAMGRAMLGIVLGERGEADADLPGEIHALFGAVQSPLRRKLLGGRYRKRRERLYAALAERWAKTTGDDPSLLGRAARLAPLETGRPDTQELLDQVPHWMFTFTGSGTDLLHRTLAVLAARVDAQARVRAEIASAGVQGRPEAIVGLDYVRACLLETGRLFPPVTRTFHARPAAPGSDQADEEVVHYFPLLHRDETLSSSVHDFVPERWLGPEPDPAASASLLFLAGPRSCPGWELILFVCAAAIARQLGEHEMRIQDSRLSRDPLPFTFPNGEARLHPVRTP